MKIELKLESAKISGVAASRLIATDGQGTQTDFGGFTVTIAWSADNGFGDLTLRQDADGSLRLFTETLGKEEAKKILLKLLDDAEVVE